MSASVTGCPGGNHRSRSRSRHRGSRPRWSRETVAEGVVGHGESSLSPTCLDEAAAGVKKRRAGSLAQIHSSMPSMRRIMSCGTGSVSVVASSQPEQMPADRAHRPAMGDHHRIAGDIRQPCANALIECGEALRALARRRDGPAILLINRDRVRKALANVRPEEALPVALMDFAQADRCDRPRVEPHLPAHDLHGFRRPD